MTLHPAARSDWAALLAELAGERRKAMEFLLAHLPGSDLDCYPPALFLRFAGHALDLRQQAPWCGALDWELFAHYVLFPRVNDEDLSFHRDIFYQALWPRVKDLPAEEDRVLEVNRWCQEHASYQAQDDRTASPLTVYRCGSGRCGEESAFLVSALRSVGIAARQVYAPRWSHCGDNHAWAEALCGARWRYLGACEPEPVPDRGWFTTAASRAVLVHSRVFGRAEASPLHGEPLGPQGDVTWFNQTARYADTAVYTFRALLADGSPAAGARFHLQILNEAAFRTIAVLTAGAAGIARAALGRGSVHVLAERDGLTAEGDCGPEGLTLRLAPPEMGETPWTDFDFRAPADLRPAPGLLNETLKRERADTLLRGNGLRQARMAGYSRPGRMEWEDLRQNARGNWDQILRFLEGPDRDRRERLVRTLSVKDLRDAAADTLEGHLALLPPELPGVPEEVYWRYAACPRIWLEPLTPWRGAVLSWLAGRPKDPAALWDRVRAETALRPPAYGNLCWTPEGALRAKACDGRSRLLLLTAALRALGIPARLRPLDGAPEYWAGGGFRPVLPEETGTLRVTGPAARYGQDWTISRRTTYGWLPLRLEESLRDGAAVLTLPAGQYRLITSVRLPSGDQLACRRGLSLAPGDCCSVPLRLRPWALDDLLTRQELPALSARTLEGETVPDLFRMGEGPLLALWLEEGGEPTEHLLNELIDRRAPLPVPTVFLLRGRDSLGQPTLAAAMETLDGVRPLLDDWAYDLEAVARHLGRDPDSPPLAVLCDGAGRAVYSAGGYRAGGTELLLRIAGRMAGGAPP